MSISRLTHPSVNGKGTHSKASEARPTWIQRLTRLPWYVIALVAYYLPWLWHSAAGLTLNAYDLAEWVSLHPAVREVSVPLVAPFLLRAVLGGLALLFCLRALQATNRLIQLVFAGLALWLAITLLPPFDFFRGAWDDPNYRQQFALAVVTLLGLVALTALYQRGLLVRHARRLEIGASVVVILGAIVGELMALNVIRSLSLDGAVGIGLIGLVVCLGIKSVLSALG